MSVLGAGRGVRLHREEQGTELPPASCLRQLPLVTGVVFTVTIWNLAAGAGVLSPNPFQFFSVL